MKKLVYLPLLLVQIWFFTTEINSDDSDEIFQTYYDEPRVPGDKCAFQDGPKVSTFGCQFSKTGLFCIDNKCGCLNNAFYLGFYLKTQWNDKNSVCIGLQNSACNLNFPVFGGVQLRCVEGLYCNPEGQTGAIYDGKCGDFDFTGIIIGVIAGLLLIAFGLIIKWYSKNVKNYTPLLNPQPNSNLVHNSNLQNLQNFQNFQNLPPIKSNEKEHYGTFDENVGQASAPQEPYEDPPPPYPFQEKSH